MIDKREPFVTISIRLEARGLSLWVNDSDGCQLRITEIEDLRIDYPDMNSFDQKELRLQRDEQNDE